MRHDAIINLNSSGSRISRGAPTAEVAVLIYYFTKFLPKMQENERHLDREEGSPSPPPDPPMLKFIKILNKYNTYQEFVLTCSALLKPSQPFFLSSYFPVDLLLQSLSLNLDLRVHPTGIYQ